MLCRQVYSFLLQDVGNFSRSGKRRRGAQHRCGAFYQRNGCRGANDRSKVFRHSKGSKVLFHLSQSAKCVSKSNFRSNVGKSAPAQAWCVLFFFAAKILGWCRFRYLVSIAGAPPPFISITKFIAKLIFPDHTDP